MAPKPRQVFWLVVILAACYFGTLLGSGVELFGVKFKTFIPAISVPAEIIPPWTTSIVDPLSGKPFGLYNTLFTTIIMDLVIVVIAVIGGKAIQANGANAANFLGRAWESFIEYLYKNYMVPTLGARAKQVLPIAITSFVFILVAGFFELVPGHEAIGVIEPPHAGQGYCVHTSGNVSFITGYRMTDPECAMSHSAGSGKVATLAGAEASADAGFIVVPFLRRPTSDLSTTIALALIAFLFIEIQGIRANGVHYFQKFLDFGNLRKGGMMKGFIGYISFVVGFLELLSEFIRILSFAFRLFGNMFAGTILVFVMSFLIPMFLPTVFVALEFGVAVIQAFVFLMLITVFTSLAVESHHGGGEEAHH